MPLCRHHEILRHTKDKCFKLHGYPPRFKKGKTITTGSINVVQDDTIEPSNRSFSNQQYQLMIACIQGQMARSTASESTSGDSSMIGILVVLY